MYRQRSVLFGCVQRQFLHLEIRGQLVRIDAWPSPPQTISGELVAHVAMKCGANSARRLPIIPPRRLVDPSYPAYKSLQLRFFPESHQLR